MTRTHKDNRTTNCERTSVETGHRVESPRIENLGCGVCPNLEKNSCESKVPRLKMRVESGDFLPVFIRSEFLHEVRFRVPTLFPQFTVNYNFKIYIRTCNSLCVLKILTRSFWCCDEVNSVHY